MNATRQLRSASDAGAAVRFVGTLALGGLFLALVGGSGTKIADLDMWHEMALARELFTVGQLPARDSFAYTPTLHPVIHHEWGTGVILYAVAHAFGAPGILGLNYAVAFSAIALVISASIRAGAQLCVLLAVAPLSFLLLATGFSPFRAQAFSILLFAFLLYCLARDRQGDRSWSWLWIPVFVLWANLHGGCVLAIAALALESLERWITCREAAVHLLALAAASVIALSCTPYGFGYYGYLLRALTMDRPAINEWMALWHQPATAPVWAAIGICLSIVTYAIVGAARERFRAGAFILAGSAIGAVLRVKLLDFFAIAFLASVPPLLNLTSAGGLIRRATSWRQFWTASWFGTGLMSLLLLTHAPWWQLRVPGQPLGPNGLAYPVGPVAYLQGQRFSGNVLAPFGTGAYVSWKLYPSVRVAVDSRYEVAYPAHLVDEVFEFYYGSGEQWKQMLSKYATDLVIVPRSSVAGRRMPESGWYVCYRDATFELYARPEVRLPIIEERRKEIWGTLP